MNITRQFPVANSKIHVVIGQDCLERIFRQKQSAMEKVFVILGSPQHKIALQAHIKEIEMTIASNQLSPNRMNDITRRDKFVAELAFLELHSPDPEPELDDAFGLEKYLTAESQDTESTDTTVIHATTETFGELTNMKFIDIVEERQELFMKPKVRQYFVDNVLYREEKERRVGWYELFVDLIFVGAISKAGHVIENSFTFDDLWNFSLVFACLYAQWSHFTQYQNMIYQDDLFQRFAFFLIMSGVVVMAVCVTHSFDLDPVTNTSTIFLAATLTCRGIYALMTIMGMYFIPHMTSALRDMKLIPQIVAVVVYAPIFAFPANGTQSRADTRRIIWTIAALINLLLPFVSVFLAKRQRFRLAVSIEHMTERIGLLVVIVLGEIVVNFLFDNDSSLFNMDLLYVTLSFLIATNLFYIYFTAEQSLKKQHAIRRHRMTGVAWNLLHFPLAVFVVCIGTCLNDMLAIQSAAFTFHSYANSTSAATSKAEAVASSLDSVKITGAADPGYMTFEFQVLFTLSVAMIHFVLAALQPLHLEVEPKYRETKISSRWRIVGRAMGGLLILILGLTLRLQAGQWIIVVATLTTFGTLFEEYGGLGHSLKQKRQCKADIYLSD